jgi:hypothetical protein
MGPGSIFLQECISSEQQTLIRGLAHDVPASNAPK